MDYFGREERQATRLEMFKTLSTTPGNEHILEVWRGLDPVFISKMNPIKYRMSVDTFYDYMFNCKLFLSHKLFQVWMLPEEFYERIFYVDDIAAIVKHQPALIPKLTISCLPKIGKRSNPDLNYIPKLKRLGADLDKCLYVMYSRFLIGEYWNKNVYAQLIAAGAKLTIEGQLALMINFKPLKCSDARCLRMQNLFNTVFNPFSSLNLHDPHRRLLTGRSKFSKSCSRQHIKFYAPILLERRQSTEVFNRWDTLAERRVFVYIMNNHQDSIFKDLPYEIMALIFSYVRELKLH